MKNISSIIILLVIVVMLLGQPFYTLDETEQAIITQFGKPVGDAVTEAGLHVKMPFIQTVNYFPKNILAWDSDPGQVPTQDKTFIWVDAFARWYIKDPLLFYKTVNNVQAAQKKLDDILDATIYNFVTSHHLIEVVRSSNRLLKTEQISTAGLPDKIEGQVQIKVGREAMTSGVLKQAAPKLEQFGIALVDVKFKRINYVEEVLKKVYERMIAERKQISEKFRSEGKGESKKIQGDMEKELRRIQSEAYRQVEEIKGKADAEATRIYAEAFGKDPEFYSFVRSLDIYKRALGDDTHLVLGTESDFLKYLKEVKPVP
ncbi:MAG: protease modulator HflC [Desulfobacterota bacterium]|nr:protease modulator HflC [Thermodesulfobacteriota bacterium]